MIWNPEPEEEPEPRPRKRLHPLVWGVIAAGGAVALLVVLALLLYVYLGVGADALRRAHVTECKAHMSEVYKGLLSYKQEHRTTPSGGGVRFFGALIAEGTWPATPEWAGKLTCSDERPPGDDSRSARAWLDLSRADGTWSSYHGRDVEDFPLRKFPDSGKEALVACDGRDHRGTVVALFADGSIREYELFELRRDGTLPEDAGRLRVGPDSPVEELRALSAE